MLHVRQDVTVLHFIALENVASVPVLIENAPKLVAAVRIS